jgi:hypothetical protein
MSHFAQRLQARPNNIVRNKGATGRFAHGTPDLKLDTELAKAVQMMTHGTPLEEGTTRSHPHARHLQDLLHRNLMAQRGLKGAEGGSTGGAGKAKASKKKRKAKPYWGKAVQGPKKVTKGGTTYTVVKNLAVQPGAVV